MIKSIIIGLVRLFFLALPIAVIWGIVWLVRRARKWEREKYDRIATALQGQVIRDEKGQPVYVQTKRNDAELRVWFDRERRDPHSDDHTQHTYLVLDWMTQLGFTLFLCKDNVIFRMAEKLGTITDVEIGDPEFDKKYLIRSSDSAQVVAFFENPERRAAVNELFLKGFREFWVTNQEVRIRRMYDPSRDLRPEFLQQYTVQLQKLVCG